MMLHLAFDARDCGRNGRFHHTYGDEDSMGWLKCAFHNFYDVFKKTLALNLERYLCKFVGMLAKVYVDALILDPGQDLYSG